MAEMEQVNGPCKMCWQAGREVQNGIQTQITGSGFRVEAEEQRCETTLTIRQGAGEDWLVQ